IQTGRVKTDDFAGIRNDAQWWGPTKTGARSQNVSQIGIECISENRVTEATRLNYTNYCMLSKTSSREFPAHSVPLACHNSALLSVSSYRAIVRLFNQLCSSGKGGCPSLRYTLADLR